MKSHKEFKSALAELGQRIFHRRVLKNFATKEIAAKLSLSPEAYRNIEKGITDPSFTTLLLVAKILQITDIPRTISGKITELAVRETIHGRPVKNTDALANPGVLEEFKSKMAELQQ